MSERVARRISTRSAPERRARVVDQPTRVARRIRSNRATVGSIVKVDAPPEATHMNVVAPNGMEVNMIPVEGESVDLWVPQVGTWSYSWLGSDEGAGAISVEQARARASTASKAAPKKVEVERPSRRITSSG